MTAEEVGILGAATVVGIAEEEAGILVGIAVVGIAEAATVVVGRRYIHEY
jgi:hypothetical protein